jgi:hypothetical protein
LGLGLSCLTPPFRGGSGLRASLSSFGAVHKIRIVSIKQLVYIIHSLFSQVMRVVVRCGKKIDFFLYKYFINHQPIYLRIHNVNIH